LCAPAHALASGADKTLQSTQHALALHTRTCTMPMRCALRLCTSAGTSNVSSTSERSGPLHPSSLLLLVLSLLLLLFLLLALPLLLVLLQLAQESRRCRRMSIAQNVPVRPMPCQTEQEHTWVRSFAEMMLLLCILPQCQSITQ
jgi:hypothetical protein